MLFSWAWRLAIFALPWQTRWFADASLAGWPWEQGRWSFYASWLLILATIVGGAFLKKFQISNFKSQKKTVVIFSLFVALTLLTTSSIAATAQWWVQILLLAALAVTLRRAEIPRREIATWFVISLLPHVAFGFWQYAAQGVSAVKWLGIAAQDPRTLGVSVVEAAEFRTLRAYGGFPHPNIFGGWLAIGLVTSLALAKDAANKIRVIGWTAASSAIAVTLVLTFSRGAWIAALVGIVVLAIRFRRSQFFRVALVSVIVATSIVGFSQRHLFASRLSSAERLEQKSFEERGQSLRDGLKLFLARPIFGTGPNAELVAMNVSASPAPLESPHNAFLLAFVNVGVGGILLLGWFFRKRPLTYAIFLPPLLILAFFDHYLWSYWSGQALATIALLTVLPPLGKVEPDIG